MEVRASPASWAWRDVGCGFYTFRDTDPLTASHVVRPSLNSLAHTRALYGVFKAARFSPSGRGISKQEGFQYDFPYILIRAELTDASVVSPTETLVHIEVPRCVISAFRRFWPWRYVRAARSGDAIFISSMAAFGGPSAIIATTRMDYAPRRYVQLRGK